MGDEEAEVALPEETMDERILFEACMVGKVGTAKTCLEKTPSLLTVKSFKRGWSPLQVAAGHNSLGVVEMLLEAGAVCNAADNMAMTPLHSAADVDDATIMEKLTATETGKAAIDLQDEDGCTPLHHAAYAGRAEIVKVLLAAGAAPSVANGEGKTPLEECEAQSDGGDGFVAVKELLTAACAA